MPRGWNDGVEIRQLRYFVTVAEELHFGRAARRLYMTQPPLSAQIHRLEIECGALLFDRTGHQVALTATGEVLLSYARQILAEADEALRVTTSAGRGHIGSLRIGMSSSMPHSLLPDILSAFSKEHPSVGIELQVVTLDRVLPALQERQVDLVFWYGPRLEPDLRVLDSLSDTLFLAIPERSPLAGMRAVPVKCLEGHGFVGFPAGFIEACRAQGFEPLRHETVRAEPYDVSITLSLVAAGFGILVVPGWLTRTLTWRGLVYRPLVEPTIAVEMRLLAKDAPLSPAASSFAAVAKGHLAQFRVH